MTEIRVRPRDNASLDPVSKANPLPVEVETLADRAHNAEVYNLTLTSADTQYSFAVPGSTRRLEFQIRTAASCRYAFEAGKVAAPTAPYMTLKAEDYYYSGAIDTIIGFTLYLASATAAVVAEILIWR